MERASYDSIAFRYIAANTHLDHDTINNFRKRFLKQIEAVFIQVLCYAQAMGMLKLRTVSLAVIYRYKHGPLRVPFAP